MLKTESQVIQLRCNFCFISFPSSQFLRCSLNICPPCFTKATSKGCFNLASPIDNFVYQISLIRTPINASSPNRCLDPQSRFTLEAIDSQCAAKIKQFMVKWEAERDKIFKKAAEERQKEKEKERVRKMEIVEEEDLLDQSQSHINPEKQCQSNKQSMKTLKRTNNHRQLLKKESLKCGEITPELTPQSSLSRSLSLSRTSSLLLKDYIIKSTDHQEQLKLKIITSLQKTHKPGKVPIKLIVDSILKATQHTYNNNGLIEVVSYPLTDIDYRVYLQVLNWQNVNSVKLVKVGMNNDQFGVLLDELREHPGVETLNVSNNLLTSELYETLSDKLSGTRIKNLYISNNTMGTHKSKKLIKQLQQTMNIYI